MDAALVRRLYALPPGEFVEARNDAAQRAGSRDEAARIRKLRRPTVSAWAVNLLVADAPDDVDALAGLGERLRTAQEEMHGAELRELSAERNRTVSALARRAATLARDAGHPLPAAAQHEVETTLDAAVADPDALEAVRAGALTKALTYSGTGFTGSSSQVAAARRAESRTTSQPRPKAEPDAEPRTKDKAKASAEPGTGARTRTRGQAKAGTGTAARAKAGAAKRTETTGGSGTRAKAGTGNRSQPAGRSGTRTDAQARKESEARREARRRAVEKAERDLDAAKRRRTEARDALDAARERREAAAAERHRLRTELAKAERAVIRADDRVTKASGNVDAAESALDRARHRLTEAKAGRR